MTTHSRCWSSRNCQSMRIVMGKLNSAMLQMMVYFAAIVPCLAFSYLLRGVNLPTIAMLIVIVFFTALLITSFSLMLATVTPHRAGQTLAMLGLLAVIFFAEILCAAFCLDGVLNDNLGADVEDNPVHDHVHGGRCIMHGRVHQSGGRQDCSRHRESFDRIALVHVCSAVAMDRHDRLSWSFGTKTLEVLNFGTMVVGGYWLVMGTLMLSESPELSPRVQRGLPRPLRDASC